MIITPQYPLKWPAGWDETPAAKRKDSGRFAVTFDKALTELRTDLGALSCQSVVLSSYLPLGRRGEVLGGTARTRMLEPGVAIYFFRGEREYVLARDAFDTPLGNLRSVGLALQGLRQVERHGGAHLAERAFGGFAALPPPPAPEKPWREVLHMNGVGAGLGHDMLLEMAESMFRTLIKRAHTDKGGTTEATQALTAAIESARKELRGSHNGDTER